VEAESPLSYAGNAFGQLYFRIPAVIKSGDVDSRNAVRYGNVRKSLAAGKSALADGPNAGRYGNAPKLLAVRKSLLTDGRNAVRYGNARKIRTERKSPQYYENRGPCFFN